MAIQTTLLIPMTLSLCICLRTYIFPRTVCNTRVVCYLSFHCHVIHLPPRVGECQERRRRLFRKLTRYPLRFLLHQLLDLVGGEVLSHVRVLFANSTHGRRR